MNQSTDDKLLACTICKIIRGTLPSRKIWDHDDFMAFFPLKHINPGHVILAPKRHVDYVFDLSEEIYQQLWSAAKFLAGPIRRVTRAKRIAIAVEGFGVPHVHVHLVPVNSGNELDPNRERALSDAESDRLQSELSKALGSSKNG